MERSKQIKCVDGNTDNGVDNSDDDSDDGGDKHLTHLTQVENNVNLCACDRHLTHVVKNSPESLKSDITGHVTHVKVFGKMLVSNNVILWLRVGGLKDGRDSIVNDQKDDDEKIIITQTSKVLVRGCLLVLQRPARTHLVHLKIITPTVVTISILTIIVD
eukprot:9203478-Ditylum_brightwellii.AAC.1